MKIFELQNDLMKCQTDFQNAQGDAEETKEQFNLQLRLVFRVWHCGQVKFRLPQSSITQNYIGTLNLCNQLDNETKPKWHPFSITVFDRK